MFFLISLLISIPVLLYLMNRIEYVRYEYEIKELKERKQLLQMQQQYLEVEKASLEDPLLIEKKARRDLSLVSQEEGGYLVVVQFRPPHRGKEILIAEKRPDRVREKNHGTLIID